MLLEGGLEFVRAVECSVKQLDGVVGVVARYIDGGARRFQSDVGTEDDGFFTVMEVMIVVRVGLGCVIRGRFGGRSFGCHQPVTSASAAG